MSRRARVVVAVVVAIAWLLVGVAVGGGIALEALTLSDKGCRIAAIDAVGEVDWQLWPPGEVCTYLGARTSEPPAWRAWVLIAELVVGTGLVVAWRRSRGSPDPDWAD